MCIICVSPSGVKQPSVNTLRTMFYRNPHGAGYMFARGGKVTIHKGFMDVGDFLCAVRGERFTAADSVVYHFRISTQAGINPEMTHPFPLSNQPRRMRALDLICRYGIAHNGIIHLTSDPDNHRYSDTAIFITDYLSTLIRKPADLRNQALLETIYTLARSKFAIMDGGGYVATVGEFIDDHGLLYSNDSYQMDRRV
jgi:predicted glutamine amidotransferase